MFHGPMIFLTGRMVWQWCLGACLAGAILFVSGCAKVVVPNVEGLTQDAATTAIAGAKLKLGALTQQTSNTVTIGKVISQNPAIGSSVAEGSQVSLVISSGPQMVAVPTVEELTQDAATTTITGAKLKVGTINQQTSQHGGFRQSNCMDGFELLDEIRALGLDAGGGVPVTAMSAFFSQIDRSADRRTYQSVDHQDL